MLDTLTEVTLVAANFFVYALFAYQARQWRAGPARVTGAPQAFAYLETELRRKLPTLSRGFTWKEAVGEARKLGVTADWSEVGNEVDAYEAYRYGGEREPVEFKGVLALAKGLRGSR